MKDTLQIGIAGLGKHALERVIPACQNSSDVEICAVQSRDRERVAEVSESLDCLGFTSWSEFLNCKKIDLVYVAVPQAMHYSFSKQALESGKHVWCEKSLCTELIEVAHLLEFAEKQDLTLCEIWQFPYHLQFLKVLELLPVIGNLRHIDAQFTIPHFDNHNNIRYLPELGGGAFWDLACYLVHFVERICRSKPVAIQGTRSREAGYSVDTFGMAKIQLASNVTAHITWGFGESYRNHVEVWGQEGHLEIPFAFTKKAHQETKVILHSKIGKSEEHNLAPFDPFIGMIAEYCRAIHCQAARRNQYSLIRRQADFLFALDKQLKS